MKSLSFFAAFHSGTPYNMKNYIKQTYEISPHTNLPKRKVAGRIFCY